MVSLIKLADIVIATLCAAMPIIFILFSVIKVNGIGYALSGLIAGIVLTVFSIIGVYRLDELLFKKD